jgi:DNA-binding beta-propeller fold protein YncE
MVSCAANPPVTTAPLTVRTLPWATKSDRLVWLRNINQPSDLGIRASLWKRLLNMVSGGETILFSRPYGVLYSTSGILYISDPTAGIVHCLDSVNGNYSVIGSTSHFQLLTPLGLTEDNDGVLYISDSTSGMVYTYNPANGTLKQFLSKPLDRPTGIAFHVHNKLLYVVDTNASQIVVLNKNGIVLRRIGFPGTGEADFNHPVDIAIDNQGNIYVSDTLNFRVTKLSPDEKVLLQISTADDDQPYFGRPKGIGSDSSGNIYVCDALMDAVQVFDQQGMLQLVIGRNGSGPAQFWMPSGLFVDKNDYIYVVDTYNQRIQLFKHVKNSESIEVINEESLFDKTSPP